MSNLFNYWSFPVRVLSSLSVFFFSSFFYFSCFVVFIIICICLNAAKAFYVSVEFIKRLDLRKGVKQIEIYFLVCCCHCSPPTSYLKKKKQSMKNWRQTEEKITFYVSNFWCYNTSQNLKIFHFIFACIFVIFWLK